MVLRVVVLPLLYTKIIKMPFCCKVIVKTKTHFVLVQLEKRRKNNWTVQLVTTFHFNNTINDCKSCENSHYMLSSTMLNTLLQDDMSVPHVK